MLSTFHRRLVLSLPRFPIVLGRFKSDEPKRKQEIVLDEKDLEELFIKGGGPGGQKINKSVSCVQLKHKPTGIIIKVYMCFYAIVWWLIKLDAAISRS